MNGPQSYVLFIYMPFGVMAASQFFTLWVRGLYDQLPKKLQNYILIYLDDILIHSPDLKSHFEAMKQLFSILEKNHAVLQTNKCQLFATHIEYLGFTISENCIRVKSTYLGKIRNWESPQNLKDLEKFLGFWSYYSSSIMNFAEKAYTLSELRKNVRNKKQQFVWSPKCQQEFETLKTSLLQSPLRAFPILSTKDKNISPLIVTSDFSA